MAQDYDAGGMLRRPSGVRTDVGTLLGRTMRLVALTVGVALDAYLARNLSGVWAMAFWIASFSNVDPEAVWEAGGTTALFVPAAAPAAMRRDETSPHPARVLLWALIVLIAFGVLLNFLDPGRLGRLCAARTGDLRRSGDVRLPAAARHQRDGHRAVVRPSHGRRAEAQHSKESPTTTKVVTAPAAPARATVWIPDGLTALAAGPHGKLTLLLGEDQ